MSDTPSERLLVLDLDETLIYATRTELDRPADFIVGSYNVYERPHLAEFLLGASRWFQLAVWSSASPDYVGMVASRIVPDGLTWRFVWGRNRCVQRTHFELLKTQYLKDLKKVRRLGYSLEKTLIVDDSPHKLRRNYGNAIYVTSFEGASDDHELPRLLKYLGTIYVVENYRQLEKRSWRTPEVTTTDTNTIFFYGHKGEYGCLSNFSPHPVKIDGRLWRTAEHYYQAQKFAGTKWESEVFHAPTPLAAARIGGRRDRPIRSDWERVKVDVMRRALLAKFRQHADIRAVLLATGDRELVEHTRKDAIWGDGGDGSGQNLLGKLLMEIRAILRSETA